MASFVTETNDRGWQLKETLKSLADTVNWDRHRLFVIDNGSTQEAHDIYAEMQSHLPFTLIALPENVGTARAINRAWVNRRPGEHAAKLDSDIRIHESGWLDKLEQCLERDPQLGIVALKRKDLIENPWRPEGDWYRSELRMLPHQLGQEWLVVEKVNHAIGTAQLYSSSLLDKIGYLFQGHGRKYGFDDSLAGIRCMVAGFYSAFYPHYHLEHLDPGQTNHQKDKEREAGEWFGEYHRLIAEYTNGTRSVYYGPNGEQ